MTTSTSPRTPVAPPEPPKRPLHTVLKGVVVVTVGFLLVATGSLIGLRLARAGVLPGVTVDGVDLGGAEAEQLNGRLRALGERKGSAEIVAVREEQRYSAQSRDLGYAVDIDATAQRALYRGRQGNPIAALNDHVRAFWTTTEVAPVESVDQSALNDWAETAADELEQDPREGALRFDGAQIRRVDPRPGARVDRDDLQTQARALVLQGSGGEIAVETDAIEPQTTSMDVDEILEIAELAVSEPVTLRRNGAAATLSPDDIGDVLRTRVAAGASETDIELLARPKRLAEIIGTGTISGFEREPQSASFSVSGGNVRLNEGHKGFTYHPRKAARQLVAVATEGGDRDVGLDGDIEDPELTTKQAKDLEVVEKVSEFTTNHDCCQTRVENIHRFADLVDDTLIMPGETLSLNDHVGERTEAKGFLPGGAIFEGEFVEQIGGGVSQFATTAYNAAWFGGYEIPEHKAHSYYISRYPEGREATLNYPNVDLKIKNNSPHGLVINTSYTDTSITVSTYGKKWVEVESDTGPRRNPTEPTTIYKENDELPKGRERVIQEAGSGGFDITVTRTLRFPNGTTKRDEVFTRYLPQPKIIERNT